MRHCRGPDGLVLDTWNLPIAAGSTNVSRYLRQRTWSSTRSASLGPSARRRRADPAAVRRADLDPPIAVERAVKNQIRERNRGLERVADRVRKIAVAAGSRSRPIRFP